MSKRGRLEAQIHQASNWSVTATGSSTGTSTVNASSSRYPTDLLGACASAWSTTTGDTVTVTGSWGEAGTGKVTIASTATLAINWGSATDLRDLLGFTGNLSGSASYTSTNHARGVWLPDCPMAAKYGPNDDGHTKTDRTESQGPRGGSSALVFQSRVILPLVRWSHVTRARARVAGESVTGESFERWWRYTHGGELAYFKVCPRVKLYWDADLSSATAYFLRGRDSTEMERAVEDWAGLFPIELVNSIKVPS